MGGHNGCKERGMKNTSRFCAGFLPGLETSYEKNLGFLGFFKKNLKNIKSPKFMFLICG